MFNFAVIESAMLACFSLARRLLLLSRNKFFRIILRMTAPHILLIDDNLERRKQLEAILHFIQYRVTPCEISKAMALLAENHDVAAILLGAGMEKLATTVKDLVARAGDVPVVLLIDTGTVLQIATPIQKMVAEVLEWPAVYPALSAALEKLLAARAVPRAPQTLGHRGLAGNSPALQRIRTMIEQVATTDSTVLILGESGTGKEVVARCVHRASPRRNRPFVPVNCGAIPGELLESELFGHEKGAFTGALSARQGRFELAEGGTLFLDEIGDMPMTMQVKLLRVLQERTFERVGSNKTITCDVRIIAATHRQLEHEIEQNRFREDLFYRLNVFPIELPPLRERREDIPLLARHLIERLASEKHVQVDLSPAALACLQRYPWPGNVRELANLIERLAILYPGMTIEPQHLPEKFQSAPQPAMPFVEETGSEDDERDELTDFAPVFEMTRPSDQAPLVKLPEEGIDLKEYLNVLECELIRQALEESGGVVAHAAKRLNLRRTTLVEKLKKYQLQR